MKNSFKKENDGIFRLDVPFDDIYTSFFLIEGDTPILIDSATTRQDVEEIILPALEEKGIGLDTNGYLLITHRHGDHNGGTKHLLEYLPNFKALTLSDGERIGDIVACSLSGHASFCFGYIHSPTNTLMSGDALQFYGVSHYGCSIDNVRAYENTLEKAIALNADSVLPSHDFIGGTAAAFGKKETAQVIEACKKEWEDIKSFVLTNTAHGVCAEELPKLYRDTFPSLPPLPRITIKAILAEA